MVTWESFFLTLGSVSVLLSLADKLQPYGLLEHGNIYSMHLDVSAVPTYESHVLRMT